MDDLIERRRSPHRRFGGMRRPRFGDSRLVMRYAPRDDVMFSGRAMAECGSTMSAALVRRDMPGKGAGISLAEKTLRQGERRAKALEHTVIDADSGATLAADDHLCLSRRDDQHTETDERDNIPAPTEGPHTAKLKARKTEGHQTEIPSNATKDAGAYLNQGLAATITLTLAKGAIL
jgi:hypothetical protein